MIYLITSILSELIGSLIIDRCYLCIAYKIGIIFEKNNFKRYELIEFETKYTISNIISVIYTFYIKNLLIEFVIMSIISGIFYRFVIKKMSNKFSEY